MAHILCMTTGLTGILNASFEIVRRLEADGHRITYASPWDVKESVERQGTTYVQLPEVHFDPAPLAREGGRRVGLVGAWRTASTRRREGLARLGMEAFGTVLDEVRPDLVLCDAELPEHIITIVSRGYRIALLNQFFAYWKRPGMPPVNCLLTPRDGRLRMEAAWAELKWRRLREVARGWVRTGRTDRRSILRAYARQQGFSTREFRRIGWLPPFGYRTLPTLHMTASELEFPHTPTSNILTVGPMVAAERKDPAPDGDDMTRLEGVIAAARERGQRIVYCSLSSKDPGDADFVVQVMEAVATRSDWVLIVALGGQIDAETLVAPSENIHAFRWLPQLKVLEHADCSINHGGIHTIHECLHYAVPMASYSGKRYDQSGAAARVAYHGLGISADKDVVGVDEIRDAVDRVLTDEGIRKRVDAMHESVMAYRTDRRLERTVETLLLSDPPRHVLTRSSDDRA